MARAYFEQHCRDLEDAYEAAQEARALQSQSGDDASDGGSSAHWFGAGGSAAASMSHAATGIAADGPEPSVLQACVAKPLMAVQASR